MGRSVGRVTRMSARKLRDDPGSAPQTYAFDKHWIFIPGHFFSKCVALSNLKIKSAIIKKFKLLYIEMIFLSQVSLAMCTSSTLQSALCPLSTRGRYMSKSKTAQ